MNKFNKGQVAHQCPNCKSVNIGKLNRHNYYCRECCAEVSITKKNHVYIRIHSEDGAIIRNIRVDN